VRDEEAFPEGAPDEQLVAAAEGRAGDGRRIPAIRELDRRRSSSTTEALTGLAAEPTEPADVRAAALVALGHRDEEAARSALAAALDATEAPVARRAAEALGRVGDGDALGALESATVPDGPARRSAEFAKSLIAYRLGVDEHRLARPDDSALRDLDAEATQPVVVRTPDAEQLERAIADLARELPTLTASSTGALALTCGSSEYVVVLNGALQGGELLGRLQEAPAMPAVVVKLSGGLDRWFLHAYVLTHPAEPGALELFLTRTTGDTALLGSARIESGRAVFSLRAVATPYSPAADIEGTFDWTAVELTSARALAPPAAGRGEEGGRSPRRIDVLPS
jgi:hypothetical protein